MITETAGAETPASIMEPLSRWEAASLSAIERDCARSGSYNEVVGIDLPEMRSRAGSTASTSTLYVSDDSEKGSGIDGFVVRRPVVILEAPRAPSLYGALERTLSLTRRLDRTLPELPLGLPVERARTKDHWTIARGCIDSQKIHQNIQAAQRRYWQKSIHPFSEKRWCAIYVAFTLKSIPLIWRCDTFWRWSICPQNRNKSTVWSTPLLCGTANAMAKLCLSMKRTLSHSLF